MSLKSLLPKPKLPTSKWDIEEDITPIITKKKSSIPKYGKRSDFIPQNQKDFGDGGAYPEIHIVQYPLGMGKKKQMGADTSETIALQTDKDGRIRYDLVLHQGQNGAKKIIHSTLNDMTAQDIGEVELQPDLETVKQKTEETRLALEKAFTAKEQFGKPISYASKMNAPTYVKYVPSEQQNNTSAIATSRIVRLQQAPVDPMEPPRFKHRKIPRSTGSPPPPVLRSPPRKVTVEEQQNWVIPPCISNWKNAKGYTIPLDKRLANDGRGLQDVSINDNFAKLSEALFIADRHAREEVKLRSEMLTKLAVKQKKEKEEKLRLLAQKAREERAGFGTSSAVPDLDSVLEDSGSSEESEEEELTAAEKNKLREREELRKEKARQREKELRMSNMGEEKKGKQSQSSQAKRDISEKIALGLAQPTISKEGMYDQRLFNQTAGLTSGFGGDDEYSHFDKPLFNHGAAQSIYVPRNQAKEFASGVETEKINSLLTKTQGPGHKGFKGTENADDHIRSGPVQFEKEGDVFGVDAFLSAAKRGRGNEEEQGSSKKNRSG
ncbi:SKIP/SNW domain-containing protein [Globomyces pollinis-pini]|nr:SKIP/SNW domain-containing protein [Globomyces pollinis-pini]KAJ3000171.1 Puff-specific protein Bx42 [Globomyces sp. JEL0801]